MIPIRMWPWCGHQGPHRHQLSSGFRIFLGGQRQSLEQQRMFAERNEGWRLQECQEFDHKGPSEAQGRRGRRRRRLCSPQEVLEWELAVDLWRLWVLTSPKPTGVMFVSTCSSVGLAGWDWKQQILNENKQKLTQNRDFQSSQVPCQSLVSEPAGADTSLRSTADVAFVCLYPKQHPSHFSTYPKQKDLLSSE